MHTLIHDLVEPFHRFHFESWHFLDRNPERIVGSWKYVSERVIKEGNAEPLHSIRDDYQRALLGQQKIIDGYLLLASCFEPDHGQRVIRHLTEARDRIQQHYDFLFPRWQTLEDLEELLLEGITPSNEILMEIAKRNPPPQRWYDESFEDLFEKSETP
jgi:hypothetical protein